MNSYRLTFVLFVSHFRFKLWWSELHRERKKEIVSDSWWNGYRGWSLWWHPGDLRVLKMFPFPHSLSFHCSFISTATKTKIKTKITLVLLKFWSNFILYKLKLLCMFFAHVLFRKRPLMFKKILVIKKNSSSSHLNIFVVNHNQVHFHLIC